MSIKVNLYAIMDAWEPIPKDLRKKKKKKKKKKKIVAAIEQRGISKAQAARTFDVSLSLR
jgi:hypothetical protein